MSSSDEDKPTLEKLNDLIQQFVNELEEQAVILRGAVVVWETMVFDDDGDPLFKVNYASMPNTTMAQTAGLFDMGRGVLDEDARGDDGEA